MLETCFSTAPDVTTMDRAIAARGVAEGEHLADLCGPAALHGEQREDDHRGDRPGAGHERDRVGNDDLILGAEPAELDPEVEGEPVTPTRKVKRRLMAERYRDMLDAMYTAEEERRIAAHLADLPTSIRT